MTILTAVRQPSNVISLGLLTAFVVVACVQRDRNNMLQKLEEGLRERSGATAAQLRMRHDAVAGVVGRTVTLPKLPAILEAHTAAETAEQQSGYTYVSVFTVNACGRCRDADAEFALELRTMPSPPRVLVIAAASDRRFIGGFIRATRFTGELLQDERQRFFTENALNSDHLSMLL